MSYFVANMVVIRSDRNYLQGWPLLVINGGEIPPINGRK